MRIQGLSTLGFAAGAPTWLLNSGEFQNVFVDNGAGDTSINLVADRGLNQNESLWLMQHIGPLAAGQMVSFGIAHTSNTQKRITSVQEAAGGGASTLVDLSGHIAALKLAGTDKHHIVGAGSVAFAAGVPSWLWRSSVFTGVITDTGVGNITLNLVADRGVRTLGGSPIEGILVFTFRGVLAASQLTSFGYAGTNTTKTVNTLREGAAGAESALSDQPFDVLILAVNPPAGPTDANAQDSANGVKLVAEGLVQFVAGAPSWLWQNGGFQNTIIDTGVGNVTVQLATDNGLGDDCAIIACPAQAVAASQLRAIGVNHLSNFAKQVTILQEAAAGAASALTDVNFYIAAFQRLLS